MSRATGGTTTGTGTPIPLDLLLIVGLHVLTGLAVFLPALAQTEMRPVLGFVFVVFVPGYVFVASLFPSHRSHPTRQDQSTGDSQSDGLGWIARFVFSFGASLAIVTLLGITLGATPMQIRPVSLFLSVTAFLAVVLPVAVYRRWQVPPARRVDVSLSRTLQRWFDGLVSPEDTGDTVLNLVLVVVVVFSSGVVVTGGTAEDSEFTEFGLLAPGDDGEFVATDYPSTLEEGEPARFSARITNLEGERVNYTVVVLLQRVGDDNSSVVEMSELDRFRETVEHNETWRLNHSVVPDRTGEGLRLRYLLYRGPAPQRPSADGAYRDLHLWVNVTDGNAGATASSASSTDS